VLFFASLLAHELAHSLMARRDGLQVKRITLFIFGGLSQTEEEPRSAPSELRIAILGPAMSVVVGLVLLGLARLLPAGAGALTLLRGSLLMVAWANLLLAVFNLMPAFPLDGGRVLRSLLWLAWRDVRRATLVAAGLGKVFGYGLAGVGIFLALAHGDLGDGLWLLFIGWLLAGAAEQAYRRAQTAGELRSFRVADFTSSPAVTVSADMDLERFAHAYDFMLSHGAYPVISEGRVAGLLSRDALKATPRHLWPMTAVAQAMEPLDAAAMLVEAEAPLAEAVDRMMTTGRTRLMVVGPRGDLVGVITQADVLRALRVVHGEAAN
jgi:Zn-dependent protease